MSTQHTINIVHTIKRRDVRFTLATYRSVNIQLETIRAWCSVHNDFNNCYVDHNMCYCAKTSLFLLCDLDCDLTDLKKMLMIYPPTSMFWMISRNFVYVIEGILIKCLSKIWNVKWNLKNFIFLSYFSQTVQLCISLSRWFLMLYFFLSKVGLSCLHDTAPITCTNHPDINCYQVSHIPRPNLLLFCKQLGMVKVIEYKLNTKMNGIKTDSWIESMMDNVWELSAPC